MIRLWRKWPLTLCLLWGGCGLPAVAGELKTATAEYVSAAQRHELDGVVEAVKQSTVAAEIVGRVQDVLFDVDDVVEKGAVIVRFRDTEQRARVRQASAVVEEAGAALREAELEFARIQDLHRKKLVAKSELDRTQAALESARARLKAARAGLAGAREQLTHTVIRAPYSGIVVARHVEEGETVGVGQALMTGLSLEELRVTSRVPQSLVEAVRQRGRAWVRLPDGRTLAATGLTVFPYADTPSHSFRVRLRLPKNVAGVYPGSFVKALFETGERVSLVVPSKALVQRSEVTAVYVLDAAGRVGLRQVRAGRALDGQTVILAGLAEGEQVVLDPLLAGKVLREQRAGAGE
ncbi:MAG TPA: efflux RND transporter periplasmic adaptor subunit [Gammaproteobacteria bacterium]|nr:efflux RND transporter periplasmic adaptor subunit [Gammaproteobacteria bacterium]